jgi:hypothetical protein
MPNYKLTTDLKIFLAGGISNCSNWQKEAKEKLETKFIVYNPRKENFDVNNPQATIDQINWEFEHLKKADIILFWFPCETLCPITLFEFGKWLVSDKPIFVGCHPDYQRKIDIEIQGKLERPDIKIHNNLNSLLEFLINNYA